MDIKIGSIVKDRISGLEGTTTARVEYITKCIQYLVTPHWSKGESFAEGHWIDEIRLEFISDGPALEPKAEAETEASDPSRYQPGNQGFGPSAPTRAGGPVGTRE